MIYDGMISLPKRKINATPREECTQVFNRGIDLEGKLEIASQSPSLIELTVIS